MGEQQIGAYELRETGLVHVSGSGIGIQFYGEAQDVSATVWDHLIHAHSSHNNWIIQLRHKEKDEPNRGWRNGDKHIISGVKGADRKCRISTNEHYNVMSWGQSFGVWKY